MESNQDPENRCPPITYSEPITSFEFNDEDDETCRFNANSILNFYTESYPFYVIEAREVCDWMVQMLDLMEEGGVSLFDNKDFLSFASVTPSGPDFGIERPSGMQVTLPDNVREAFLSEEGAEPFDSPEVLEDALQELFDFRVE